MTLYTLGYTEWGETKTRMPGLVASLKNAGVNLLIDIRLSPCSSRLDNNPTYGPKDWTLQVEPAGIAARIAENDMRYRWLVELGNPQKADPDMAVLRHHIDAGNDDWPVNRGLKLLDALIRESGNRCCLMCGCDVYAKCHRRLVAETIRDRYFEGQLGIENVGPLPKPPRRRSGSDRPRRRRDRRNA